VLALGIEPGASGSVVSDHINKLLGEGAYDRVLKLILNKQGMKMPNCICIILYLEFIVIGFYDCEGML
jgi:hypothetical protein